LSRLDSESAPIVRCPLTTASRRRAEESPCGAATVLGSSPSASEIEHDTIARGWDSEDRAGRGVRRAELAFEIDYQLSLTTAQRFEMMQRRSREMAEELLKRGYRSLLRSLNAHSVRYVVIAPPLSGPRLRARDARRRHLHRADSGECRASPRGSHCLRYDLSDVSVDDLLRQKVLIRQYVLESTSTPSSQAPSSKTSAQPGRGASRNRAHSLREPRDLIRMKRRRQVKDLEDLRALREIQRRRK